MCIVDGLRSLLRFLFLVEWRQYSYNPETGELGNSTQNTNITYNKQYRITHTLPQCALSSDYTRAEVWKYTNNEHTIHIIQSHQKCSNVFASPLQTFNNILDLINKRTFSYATVTISTNKKWKKTKLIHTNKKKKIRMRTKKKTMRQ